MKAEVRRYARSQGGYTLIELLVASAIGLFVMTGLTSVVLTSWRAATTATSRIETSAQIRTFQFRAYDDFALSGDPVISSCASTDPPPCTITLSGLQVSDSSLVPANVVVTYTWDGTNVDRQVGSNTSHAATNVTAFTATATGQTIVVTLTVTVQNYSETQTLRFNPRVNP